MESLFIILFLLTANWLQWIDRKKQQNIIRNMKNGGDGVKITHNEYFLFERKKGARV
jgi:hypothetical protein